MAEPRIWTELLTYGLGVALSPIHIVLLLLLLLGGSPLRRGGFFVGGWLLTSALAVIGLLTLGHGLLLVPFLAVLIGRERVLPLLQRGKTALLRRGELVVGSLSFGLGSYLGWQGISGLMIN